MKNNKKGIILMILGIILLLSAMGLIIYNKQQDNNAKKIVREAVEKLNDRIDNNLKEQKDNIVLELKDNIIIDDNKYIGIISIPILGLKLPILEQWSYPNLKISPCRYKGNIYDNSLILLSHNYKNHFGTIDDLNADDKIIFTDVNGNSYNYVVTEIRRLQGNDVEEMEKGDWDLTLFTCSYGGKSRITVRCVRTI